MGELTVVGNLGFGVSLHSRSSYVLLSAYKTVLAKITDPCRTVFSLVQRGNNAYFLDNYEC